MNKCRSRSTLNPSYSFFFFSGRVRHEARPEFHHRDAREARVQAAEVAAGAPPRGVREQGLLQEGVVRVAPVRPRGQAPGVVQGAGPHGAEAPVGGEVQELLRAELPEDADLGGAPLDILRDFSPCTPVFFAILVAALPHLYFSRV